MILFRLPLFVCGALGLASAGSGAEPAFASPTNRPSPPLERLTNHLEKLQARLPKGFTWAWQPPFVVIGDEAPAMVRLRATNTVKWAVDLLKRDYFTRDPEAIIEIWLFKNRDCW